MHQFRKILVGVDLQHGDRLASSELNPPTQEAVRRAVWLASRQKAELTFLAALDLSGSTQELLEQAPKGYQQTVKDKAQAVLDGLVTEAIKAGVSANSHLAIGEPTAEIIRRVEQEHIDLVVVGTSNKGALRRMLFGSTGLTLLHNCPCAVWVAKPDPNWDDLNILVTTDLTDLGQSAISAAIGCAQLTYAKVHLLHAIETPYDFDVVAGAFPPAELDSLRNKGREEAEYAVNNQLSRTDFRTLKQGVQVHVEEKPIDTAILESIEKYGIDLLVIGTLSRGGVAGLLIGNTAERVLPHVSCSVLAIKPAAPAPVTAS